jgi:hypothetical protein
MVVGEAPFDDAGNIIFYPANKWLCPLRYCLGLWLSQILSPQAEEQLDLKSEAPADKRMGILGFGKAWNKPN